MVKHPSILIGEYLRYERELRGLSIEKLAAICHLSSSQISVIERGRNSKTGKYNNITLSSLELIGNGLQIPVEQILKSSGYYASFHGTIRQSEEHFTDYTRKLLQHNYDLLNSANKAKVVTYIDTLLEKQGRNYEDSDS